MPMIAVRSPEIRDLVESQTLLVGPFSIAWRSVRGRQASLRVSHAREPGRVLWETTPGEAFIRVAPSKLRVAESRGFFRIEERARATRGVQTLESIQAEGSGVCLRGHTGQRIRPRWQMRFDLLDD